MAGYRGQGGETGENAGTGLQTRLCEQLNREDSTPASDERAAPETVALLVRLPGTQSSGNNL
jgi:hypothetical protein